jgi:Asp-tRNA(Asn)/Glu-tRNA(Gln) amidotransferase C subunit
MPYIRRSGADRLSTETVELLARAVGLSVPEEDREELAEALTDQLASLAAIERLDLSNVDPVLQLDPRWPDHV